MERENNNSQLRRSGSVSRTSSINSSLRRRSLSISNFIFPLEDDDMESKSVSEAGDIGDRILHSNRHSASGRHHLSIDSTNEIPGIMLVPEDALLQSCMCRSRDQCQHSSVASSMFEISTPLPSNAILQPDHNKPDDEKDVPWLFEYTSCLLHLSVFGILGVLTRYLLQKLFGPGVVGATSSRSYMYLDLPSNMVGSFLMGWVGVVFKGDISRFSDHLAVGLATGYMGSLTTFSGWNQKMLDLSVEGQWVFTVLGFFVGLCLAGFSIIVGVDTAQLFKSFLKARNELPQSDALKSRTINKLTTYKSKCSMMVVHLLILILLWTISGVLEKKEFHNGGSAAHLWLGCLVGPFGVWIRWFLARLNGRGLGKSGLLKWIPFGTLLANVSAACIMAALATLKKAVNTENCNTVASGIQFGFLGCLSTVSTFMAEFNAMRVSNHAWRAYVYALITIVMSFTLGTLIYSVPVWAKGYD